MLELSVDILKNWQRSNKEKTLCGRYLRPSDIEPLIASLTSTFKVSNLGDSYQGRSISKITVGEGSMNILIWSQMHGNESTGTKAIFDLFRFFQDPGELLALRDQILKTCTISIIPMLNPDGSEQYTRVNAMDIDLNRDVLDQRAPESQVLLKEVKEFNPKYCFNLHDQRTLFTVGETFESATLSFLAPSEDEARTITEGRIATMKVIVAMNELVQKALPGQIGRYTDEFYPTATGDNFQKMGHNTILIESGHYKDDYQREQVRLFTFMALVAGLNYLSSTSHELSHEPYFEIPSNGECYFDEMHRSIYLTSENQFINVGVIYKELLEDGALKFEPEIKNYGDLAGYTANTIVEHDGLKMKNLNELQRFLKKRS